MIAIGIGIGLIVETQNFASLLVVQSKFLLHFSNYPESDARQKIQFNCFQVPDIFCGILLAASDSERRKSTNRFCVIRSKLSVVCNNMAQIAKLRQQGLPDIKSA